MARAPVILLGEKELRKKFRTLADKVQIRVLRNAVNAAAAPVAKVAAAKAPKQSGLLAQSIGRKAKGYKKTQSAVAIVGARKNVIGEFQGKKRWPVKYSHLREKGFIAADGSFVPPEPFLGPAATETQQQSTDIMAKKLSQGVIKEALK